MINLVLTFLEMLYNRDMINDPSIKKHIQKLPKNIRDAVEQFDWSSEILNISQTYHIQIDEIQIFRDETLLVIVGLTAASDFEKNLVKNMGISHELAEKLVAESNEHIFKPLQKMAFTHHDDELDSRLHRNDKAEEEIIEHDEISNVMSSHGIELVDEFEPESQPKNELQDLANSLFKENSSVIPDSDPESLVNNSSLDKGILEISSQAHNDKVINYNEEINESDLQGIADHRIDTSILNQTSPENVFINNEIPSQARNDNAEQSLDTDIFENQNISKTEFFNVSPTKEELVVEKGDFLDHIGAN